MGDSRGEPTDTATTVTRQGRIGPSEGILIGPYRTLERLGEGGMGEVWLAEQTHPVQRRVALKVIKSGLDSAQVVARFEAERQALALMDHPAIARVFDAGSTSQGRPYFAMEYVRGKSITTYCDRERLSIAERLELFIQVCDGVQHAHQKGIIHRDLKPSNILVTRQDDRPVPKIIDFGVAKATSQRLTEHTLYTSLGGFVGTPEYMSPEQADPGAAGVDTRTDVYALGVVLYELLTGELPFERQRFSSSGLDEIRRIIREVEPPRPSTKIVPASVPSATSRRTDVTRLRQRLRGDLDWITLRALEKDQARRYGSASDLAEDIRRHLTDQPVAAGPPSAIYRAGKFVRRHRFGVAATALVALVTIGAALVVAVQARRIAVERDRATRAADTAERIASFLVGLFEVSRPSEATANTVTAREILDRGAGQLQRDQQIVPATRASLLGTLGDVYFSMGSYERAQALLEQSLDYSRSAVGPRSDAVADTLLRLSRVLGVRGKLDEAESMARQALDIRLSLHGRQHEEVAAMLTQLGTIAFDKGNSALATTSLDEALGILRSITPVPGKAMDKALTSRARIFLDQGDFASADRALREALEISQRLYGPAHPNTLVRLQNVATVSMMQGAYARAETMYLDAARDLTRTLGPHHAGLSTLWLNLGTAQYYQRRYVDAEASYRESVGIARQALGERHEAVGSGLVNVGQAQHGQGRYRDAAASLREGIEIQRQALGVEHPMVVPGLSFLSRTELALGNVADAEAVARQALAIASKSLGATHPRTAEAEGALGAVLLARKQWADAEPLLLAFRAALESKSGAEGDLREATSNLVSLYTGWGRAGEAATWRGKLK